ncbi:hypothetical protein AeMF1_006089 [Aphanomyces euteiches]|nr:hypothetical protein AeMF1_006089 [Aphanomyces euteiches]KAH9183937.1 hypothetical protein AeNC1_014086 [Aphanomyces euteiches]
MTQISSEAVAIAKEIVETAHTILKLSLYFQVQRSVVLATALMVQTIMHHVQEYGPPADSPDLLPILNDIKGFMEASLSEIKMRQIGKIQFDHEQQLTKIQNIGVDIYHLQTCLKNTVANVTIDLNIQVVGTIEDVSKDIGNMIQKMQDLKKHIELISKALEPRHRKDALIGLAIQVQRGYEFYQQQMVLGNLPRIIDFESQVESTKTQIGLNFSAVSQRKNEQSMLNLFDVSFIKPWMLAMDDVQFDPNDESTFLGKGGFASVYKGKYQGQEVAVKRFTAIEIADSDDLEKLFVKEIKAWKDISHEPYILSLFGICTTIARPILVSELCQTNIRRYVRDNSHSLLPLVYEFAKGVVSLHNANRDLKGDNVLVRFDQTVAIADFGLSRTIASLENTKTGVRGSGTLYWMSPEQYFSSRRVTAKSDVWSFGITLWEILTNSVPFQGYTEYEMVEDVFKSNDDRLAKPEELKSELEPLWTLINKCWQLNPHARPSATSIVEFLEKHYDSQLTTDAP